MSLGRYGFLAANMYENRDESHANDTLTHTHIGKHGTTVTSFHPNGAVTTTTIPNSYDSNNSSYYKYR